MLCKQVRRQIESMSQPEGASAEWTHHLLECDPCRKLLEERSVVRGAIARVRAETSHIGPSRRVEQHVLAIAAGRRIRSHAASNRWRWFVAGALVSATIFLVAFLMTMHRHSIALPGQAAGEVFTAMPYVIPPAPYERTSVVRTEVPLQIMLAAGFQVEGEDLGSSALADVLYGEDGRILALRLVSQPGNLSTTRMD